MLDIAGEKAKTHARSFVTDSSFRDMLSTRGEIRSQIIEGSYTQI
jgi:hypothetical protein